MPVSKITYRLEYLSNLPTNTKWKPVDESDSLETLQAAVERSPNKSQYRIIRIETKECIEVKYY